MDTFELGCKIWQSYIDYAKRKRLKLHKIVAHYPFQKLLADILKLSNEYEKKAREMREFVRNILELLILENERRNGVNV